MGAVNFKAKVVEHLALTPKYHLLSWELVEPKRIDFQAGQFLSLAIPGQEQRRSYSIASEPAKNHGVEVLADISPGGIGTTYLAGMKPGDEVEFLGPMGQFVVMEPQTAVASGGQVEEELVLVATGCGISPIRSMLVDLLVTKKEQRPIKLHWGMRYVEDLFWEEDWQELAEVNKNFSYDVVLSRPSADWPLCSGHVSDCLLAHRSDYSKTGFYLCGSREMVEQMRELLQQRGVPRSNIHSEQFY